MGAASTKVPIHSFDDLLAGGPRINAEKTEGGEDHTGCAVSALKSVVIDKGLLEWMKSFFIGKPFYGYHCFPLDVFERILTRSYGLIVDQDGTGSTETLPTTVFHSCKTEFGS